MATSISKSVSRVTGKEYRTDGGRVRKIVVTLGPGEYISLRPLRGQEVTIPVESVYWQAVKASALYTLNNGGKA